MTTKADISEAIRHVVNVCACDTVTITLSQEDAMALCRDLDLAVGLGRAPITGRGVVGKITGSAKDV